MAASYKVTGMHFEGVPATIRDIKIVSGKISFVPTVTSYPRNLEMPQGFYLVQNRLGETLAMDVTVYNKYATSPKDRLANGPITQIDDYRIESWRHAAEGRHSSSFPSVPEVKITPASFLAESFGERKSKFYRGDTDLDKRIHDIEMYGVPINDTGKWIHKARELKRWIKDYAQTEDGQELLEKIGSESVGKIKHVAVGGLPGAIMGVIQLPNGEIIITMAENAYDMLDMAAKKGGVDKDSAKRIAVAEELIHAADMSVPEIPVKAFKRDYYKKRTENFSGNPKYQKAEARNRRRTKAIETDIAEIDQNYTLFQQYARVYAGDRKSLEMVLELEAYNMGLEGNDIKDYVASKMEKISRAVERGESTGIERKVNEARDDKAESKDAPKEEATAPAD